MIPKDDHCYAEKENMAVCTMEKFDATKEKGYVICTAVIEMEDYCI